MCAHVRAAERQDVSIGSRVWHSRLPASTAVMAIASGALPRPHRLREMRGTRDGELDSRTLLADTSLSFVDADAPARSVEASVASDRHSSCSAQRCHPMTSRSQLERDGICSRSALSSRDLCGLALPRVRGMFTILWRVRGALHLRRILACTTDQQYGLVFNNIWA